MKGMLALLFAAVGACNAQPPSASPLAQVNCIDLARVSGRRVLPPSAVLFEMVGGISYRNDLQGTCPSAARGDGTAIVQTESQSPRLCRDDHVRIYDPVEARATGATSFPPCRLGSFTAVPVH